MSGYEKKKKLNSRGFTLGEVLLVVAIILVLAGLGASFISSYLESHRQLTADSTAESVAMAFQNRMQEIYTFDSETGDKLGDVDGVTVKHALLAPKTYRIKSEFNEDQYIDIDVNYNAILINKGEAKSSDLLKFLTADGELLSSELFENGIIIEYDPVNFRVYSVTYCTDTEKYPLDSLYTASNMDIIRDNARRDREFKGYVGYYQIAADDGMGPAFSDVFIDNDTRNKINVRVGHYVNGERRLYNSDKLIGNIDIVFPSGGSNYYNRLKNKKVLIRVEIEGETSKNKMVFSEWGTYIDTMEYTNISLVLDAFGINEVNGKNSSFAGQFSKKGKLPAAEEIFKTVHWLPEGKQSVRIDQTGAKDGENTYLIPGENIVVTVKVASYSKYTGLGEVTEDALLFASASASDNSLFAYDNGIFTAGNNKKSGANGVDYTAYIAYGRHLQNLDESSGIADAVNEGKFGTVVVLGATETGGIYAVQTRDIDFARAVGDEEPVLGKVALWYNSYTGKNFTPILNKHLKSYTGKNDKEEEPKAHKILNLVVDESHPENSAITELNIDKTAAVPRTYLAKEAPYVETINEKTVYDRYCTGLFRVFSGDRISDLILVDPKITGIRMKNSLTSIEMGDVVGDGVEPGVVASTGALAGVVLNDAEIMNCEINISDTTPGSETGWIKTVIEPASATQTTPNVTPKPEETNP